MKATVPQTNIGKMSVQSVDVGEIDAGPISIASSCSTRSILA